MFIYYDNICYFTSADEHILYHLFSEKLALEKKVIRAKPQYIKGTRELIQAHQGKYLLLNGLNKDGSYNTGNPSIKTVQKLAALMMLNEDEILHEKFCMLVLSIMDNKRRLYNVTGEVVLDFNKWSPEYRYTYEMLLIAAKRCGLKDAARELLKFRFTDKLLKLLGKPPQIDSKYEPKLVAKVAFIL